MAEHDLRSAYYERREARADARDRPDHHDRDEETYPSDTLHKIIRSTTPTRTTPKSSSKPSRESSRPTPATRRKRKQGPPSGPGATPSSGKLASDRPATPSRPPDLPTPPAPSTEEPEAGEDPPPQEPEEHRPAPTGPSHYERKAMSKGIDIWRDPADSWISADANPTGYQPSTRIDSTYFPRGP